MKLKILLGLISLWCAITPAIAQQMWVTSDTLNRRTCPGTHCGAVGKLFFRESATIYERRNGWGRVSKYYDASCVGGRSEYVDSGNAACDPSNGIVDGKFAEWISIEFVSADRPADPGARATGTSKLIGQSDDFRKYEAAFTKAAEALLAAGDCTRKDFEDMGGFVKSGKGATTYFTYCRGGSDRIYLDAATGRIYR
jgi:hypothetical protein